METNIVARACLRIAAARIWLEFSAKRERQNRCFDGSWHDYHTDEACTWWTATEERIDYMVRYVDPEPLTI